MFYAGTPNGLSTCRCASVRGTGFQRDIECAAARSFAGYLQCHCFSVRPARPFVPADADDLSVVDDDRTNSRIRVCCTPASLGQLNSLQHQCFMLF